MLREQEKVQQNLIGGKKFEPSSVRHLQVSSVTKPWEEDIKSPTSAFLDFLPHIFSFRSLPLTQTFLRRPSCAT